MAQPQYVPVVARDRVRVSERLPTPKGWTADRPAEVVGAHPTGSLFGVSGPDQGYALKLAHLLHSRLQADHPDDAVAGCLPVALKRAATFGRAPVMHDLEVAFTLWGFLGDAPADLVAFRKPLFDGAAHDYLLPRAIAALVPEATLRMTPLEVQSRLAGWRELIAVA